MPFIHKKNFCFFSSNSGQEFLLYGQSLPGETLMRSLKALCRTSQHCVKRKYMWPQLQSTQYSGYTDLSQLTGCQFFVPGTSFSYYPPIQTQKLPVSSNWIQSPTPTSGNKYLFSYKHPFILSHILRRQKCRGNILKINFFVSSFQNHLT